MKTKILIGLFLLLVVAGGLSLVLAQSSASVEDYLLSEWKNTDISKKTVSLSEIIPVLPADGIPPYYPEGYVYPDNVPRLGGREPFYTVRYASIEETNAWLPDEQQVIVVTIGEEAKAYPLILLNNHEIANTEIGGIPIAVTFCPLCNASIVYDRRINGEVHHFGVSGMLRNSDLIMWDHESQTLWQQFTGEGIVGEFAGTQLTMIPSLVTGWGQFKAAFPNGVALANQHNRNLLDNISYFGYDRSGQYDHFFSDDRLDNRLFSTTRVLGYFGAEGAIAYPFERLAEVGVVNDRIGGEAVVVFWQPGSVSLFSPDLETGSAGLFEATLEDGRELTFVFQDNLIRDQQTGSTWSLFGLAVEGELSGTQLRQKMAYPHFWFAWAAFRPDTLIWEAGMIADEAWANAR